MSLELLLGIDVGTTSSKAAVIGIDGNELSHGRAPVRWRDVPTGAEADPDDFANAAIASDDATIRGYDKALLLSQDGTRSEASSANVFLVRGKKLVTPRVSGTVFMMFFLSIISDLLGLIGGFFVDSGKWKTSAKDAQTIGQIMQSSPITVENAPLSDAKPAQAATCAPFDVTVDSVSGKGACFNDAATKTATVAMVFADDGVGYLLSFSQKGIAADKLKDSAVAMLPNFKIDRAKGDLGLMRWMR